MEKEVYGVIYDLIDGTNDYEYIGQTTRSVERRFKEHFWDKKSYISNAIRLHGADMFVIAILKVCYSKEELDYWERRLIKSHDTLFPNGYNLTEGSDDGKHCDATRTKLSAANAGKKLSDEHRASLLAAHTGIPQSPKTCSKISSTQRAESPFKNLIEELDAHYFSYRALAKLMNLPRQAISGKIRGKRNFTETEWIKLAEIFGKSVDYLMVRNDEKISSMSKRHSSPYKNLVLEIDNRKLTYTALARLMKLPTTNFSAKIRGVCNFSETEWAKLVEIFDKPADYLMVRCDGLPAITSKADKNVKISAARRQDTQFKNLLYEMDNRQLSYKSLARLLGLSTGIISLKMRCERKFTEQDIAKLVEIFDKPADYLMTRDETE